MSVSESASCLPRRRPASSRRHGRFGSNHRRWQLPLLATGAFLGALGFSGTAEALPLISLSASVRGLYGSAIGDSLVSAYGPGVGLRAGVTLPLSLYLGASYDYFVGDSLEAEDLETSTSTQQIMANVGYDLGLGPLSLRPLLGLGLSSTSVEVKTGLGGAGTATAEDSKGNFVVAPGAELTVGLGIFSVGGEVRYNKVFADGDSDALVVGAGVGLSF